MCRVLVYEYYFTLYICILNELCGKFTTSVCFPSTSLPNCTRAVKSTKVSPTMQSPVAFVNYPDTQTHVYTNIHDKAIYSNFVNTIEHALPE